MTESVEFIDGVEVYREELPLDRTTLILSASEARLKLKQLGFLEGIITYMEVLPPEDDLKILWEYSSTFERTNPVLISFCTEVLALTEEQLDSLFL